MTAINTMMRVGDVKVFSYQYTLCLFVYLKFILCGCQYIFNIAERAVIKRLLFKESVNANIYLF